MNNSHISMEIQNEEVYFLHLVSESSEETRLIGEEVFRFVLPGTFFLLYGNLGTGKTEFVRGFARGAGCDDVRSPSFTIVNEYLTLPPIVHADLYRVDVGYSSEFAFEEYSRDGYVIIIEWAEHMETEPISDAWEAKFSYQKNVSGENVADENIRIIDITCRGERACRSMNRLRMESEFIRTKLGN